MARAPTVYVVAHDDEGIEGGRSLARRRVDAADGSRSLLRAILAYQRQVARQ